MKNRILVMAVAFLLATGLLSADGSYVKKETTTSPAVTPGMRSMMSQFGNAAGNQALKPQEPTTEVTMVHGNRLVTVAKRGSVIWNLDKGTMTQTDSAKHEYSIMTFQQLVDSMEKMTSMTATMPSAAAPASNGMATNSTYEIKQEHPDTMKEIAGLPAREYIYTLTTTTKISQGGAEASTVAVEVHDFWVLDGVPPAYQEEQDFMKRIAEKAGMTKPWERPTTPVGLQSTPAAGLLELRKRIDEIKGLRVSETTSISLGYNGMPAMPQTAQMPAPQPTTEAAAPPAASDSQAQTAVQGAAQGAANSGSQQAVSGIGGFGGALARGALGGFSLKKKKPAPAPAPAPAAAAAPAPPPAAQAAPPAAGGPGGRPLSVTTTELTNFSTEPVPPSEFDVPAGYKQVPSPIEKLLNSPR